MTDRIIGQKSLLPNFADNFNGTSENGDGSVFEVQYGGTDNQTTSSISTYLAPTVSPYNGAAFSLPTDENLNGEGGGLSSGNAIVQEFEAGDKRFHVTLATYGLPHALDPNQPNGSLYYINKFYNAVDPIGNSTWNFPLIRYADVLLMRAEAINEIGYSPDSESFSLVNQLRERAGLAPVSSGGITNQEMLRQAIRHERRVELAFEVNRYFDLNRWGILESTIQAQMNASALGGQFPSNKVDTHEITRKPYHLFPIPFIELSNNAKLSGNQNPGY